MADDTLVFNVDEAEFLYTIPKPGGDLSAIVHAHVFVNRSGTPSFAMLRDFLAKSLQAGIIQEDNGDYQITEDWYKRIHRFDESSPDEVQSMVAFVERFAGLELPVVVFSPQPRLTEGAYQAMFSAAEREHESFMSKARALYDDFDLPPI